MAAAVTTEEVASWAREVLASAFGAARLREYADAGPRERVSLAARLRAELADAGMLGAAAELGVPELTAIAVEAGRALLPVDLGSAAVAIAAGDEALGARVAAGEIVPAAAWRAGGGAARLTADGTARVVVPGHDAATHALVPGRHCAPLRLVALDRPGVRLEQAIDLDPTRPLGVFALGAVEAVELDDPGDLAALFVAADSLGAMRAAHAIAVAHALERRQFGAPIGSFQQVAALLAQGHVHAELAGGLVADAADAFEDGRDPAGPVAMAKAYACEHGRAVAADAIQVLGGSGFTWETLAHLHFRRTTVNLDAHGGPGWHRTRIL